MQRRNQKPFFSSCTVKAKQLRKKELQFFGIGAHIFPDTDTDIRQYECLIPKKIRHIGYLLCLFVIGTDKQRAFSAWFKIFVNVTLTDHALSCSLFRRVLCTIGTSFGRLHNILLFFIFWCCQRTTPYSPYGLYCFKNASTV